jgi:hypothetical protein
VASQGFVRVRPAHSASLVKQYRRLLGERKFWAARSHHPQAEAKLARLNTAINALAKALPLVAPGVGLAELKPLPFHMAVPLPGHALKRAVLAGLRKLGQPTADPLVEYIVETHGVDLTLHDSQQLIRRVQRTLDSLVACDESAKETVRPGTGCTAGAPPKRK